MARDRSGAVNLRGNEPVYAVSGVSLPASQPPAPPLLLSSLTRKVANSAAQPSPAVRPLRSCFHCHRLNHIKINCRFPKPYPAGVQWPPPSDLEPPKLGATPDEVKKWISEAKCEHPKLTTAGEYRGQLK